MEILESAYPLLTPPISVSSAHTKHALESLHHNISVFRHPDHLPDAKTLESTFLSSIKNLKLTAANASKLPQDALKAIYGVHEDSVLYWVYYLFILIVSLLLIDSQAHHEKLCIIDGAIAFMGGLDLVCYF